MEAAEYARQERVERKASMWASSPWCGAAWGRGVPPLRRPRMAVMLVIAVVRGMERVRKSVKIAY